ncbi:MAG: HAD family hydrolase [Pseudomonadota bacterium]
MKKALVFDIDGTLITTDKRIPEETIDIVGRLHRCHDVGVVLASGRMPKSVRRICSELAVPCHLVSFNGALAETYGDVDASDRKILADYPVSPADVARFLSEIHALDLTVSIFGRESWIANRDDYWMGREKRGNGFPPDRIVGDTIAAQSTEEPIYKVMVRGEESQIATLQTKLDSVVFENVVLYSDRPTIIEITSASANKATSVATTLELLDIRTEEAFVFGDADNDLEMMRLFPDSVAMANSSEAVLDAARFRIGTNNEPSIADFLRAQFSIHVAQ